MALERIPYTPPDPTFGIQRLADADKRPNKVNVTTGELYIRDEESNVEKLWIPSAFTKAEREGIKRHNYITAVTEARWLALPEYVVGSAEIVYGEDVAREIINEGRLVAVGAEGGTNAIFSFARAVEKSWKQEESPKPLPDVLISNPTWSNHRGIFEDTDFNVRDYPHLRDNRYNLEAHVDAIKKSGPDTIVLFHAGRTHNPTGDNPSTEGEWEELADAMFDDSQKGRFAIFDAAYLGWGDGLETDALGMRKFREKGVRMAVALSNSKNGGIYSWRTGLLLVEEESKEKAESLQNLLRDRILRRTISNPSSPGEEVMGRIFSNNELFEEWQGNLAEVRQMFLNRRNSFVEAVGPMFDYVIGQRGLFSLLLSLSRDQVIRLREEHGIYLLENGRINIGSLNEQNIPLVAKGIKSVLG